MVAMYEADDFVGPRTLCDWVKNFRVKKFQMKRKLRSSGGDSLRVCAILSTALLSAEHELRRKQQQRFSRWLEMQAKFDKKLGRCDCDETRMDDASSSTGDNYVNTVVENNRREEITNLWKCELSGLDEFMRSMSTRSGNSPKAQANTVAS